MKTFIHRFFVHQHNVFPAQEANARTIEEVAQQTSNDPTVTHIEERIFCWQATKNYTRMGQPMPE